LTSAQQTALQPTPSPEIHFGGPAQPPGHLRDLLAEHIAAIPAGGSIDWVTYYFRDLRLAQALIQAKNRGVRVTVSLEGRPRIPHANNPVVAMLSGASGLGEGFRPVALPGIPSPPTKSWKPQLHEKLYCFSHPRPIAFIGSFNPSGNMPNEDPEIIREIGDQDRGYNVLVGFLEPDLVEKLVNHARQVHHASPSIFYRFSPDANRAISGTDTTIHFWPRVSPHPVIRFLDQVSNKARVRVVASHIRTASAVETMIALAKRGVALEIFAEATHRRVTPRVERLLTSAGIRFRRIRISGELPMHLKFVLVEDGNQVNSIFGSFNWTRPSFWLNHEIAAISSNRQLFEAFAERWDMLESEKSDNTWSRRL
jgi:phosphatidylserine/phosphatidylglycerophosphate/cardiolipin synthase-like enzyme